MLFSKEPLDKVVFMFPSACIPDGKLLFTAARWTCYHPVLDTQASQQPQLPADRNGNMTKAVGRRLNAAFQLMERVFEVVQGRGCPTHAVRLIFMSFPVARW